MEMLLSSAYVLQHMMATALPGIFQTVAPFLDSYGYWAIGVLLFVEDFGIPVPGETILITSAIYAGAGKLSLFILIPVAIITAVLGDNVGFAIGHYGGEQFVLKFGKYVFLTKKRFDHARSFFNRFGGPIITVARFIDGLRQVNGIIAGASDMHWRRFLLFNVIGASLWVGAWSTLGYLAGNNINEIYGTIVRYERYALWALIVLVVAFVAYKVHKRHQRRRSAKQ